MFRCLHHIQEQTHAAERPLDLPVLGLELRGEHLLSEAPLGLVHGTLVRVLDLRLVHRHRADGDDRHGAEHLLGAALLEYTGFLVPPAALQRETVDVRAIAAGTFDLIYLLLSHLSQHHGFVQRPVVAARGGLHDGGEEGLRVEQAAEPHHLGERQVCGPLHQLLHTREQVADPASETAQRRVGQLGPRPRHRALGEGVHERFHRIRHGEVALEAEVQFGERALHLRHQHVHALRLLNRHHDVRRDLVGAPADLLHVELFWKFLHHVV
mmetsp:Transcript_21858/g.35400  ORF Transcript_21858/g.35400 Transcript_21858/m.35400 type:complete len:268 (+) Transcript_21858:862-1665(+)